MSTKFYVIAVWTLLSFVVKVNAQDKVECWDRFELSFKQVTKGNPFDTRLSATFICGKEKKTVEGFYDGENTYRIRFMPAVAGSNLSKSHSFLSFPSLSFIVFSISKG